MLYIIWVANKVVILPTMARRVWNVFGPFTASPDNVCPTLEWETIRVNAELYNIMFDKRISILRAYIKYEACVFTHLQTGLMYVIRNMLR